MAKILTDKELLKIIQGAIEGNDIEDAAQYGHFLADIANLIGEHFGADVGDVTPPFNEEDRCNDWMIAFSPNECTPSDGRRVRRLRR